MRFPRLLQGFTAALLLTISTFSFAGEDREIDENDVILAGYDAVAYFTKGKPVLGSAEFTALYQGAIYRFSSAEHRDAFKKEPSRYAPQYGGFCAYGLTFGKKFEVNGEAFEIVDGKLYVNKDRQVYNAWKANVPLHIQEANEHWGKVK